MSLKPRPQDTRIAEVMANAAECILWAHVKDWAYSRLPDMHIEFRVGSGKKTYLSRRHNDRFRINFGAAMVRSVGESAAIAARWRHGNEILTKGYMGGDLSLINAHSHVVVHEFAHLIQSVNGWRAHNSVHNADFYKVCKRIHDSGKGEEVRQFLLNALGPLDYETPGLPSAAPLKTLNFRSGDQLAFNHNGQIQIGNVIRVNSNTYTVKTEHSQFRVPKSMATMP